MTTLEKNEIKWVVILRLFLGWLFFYAGLTKIFDPAWTAKGYLMGAKTFTGFYYWLASPALIGLTNFLNEWGLTLIGLSLILGIGVKLSARLGAVMMILYYFPVLNFPYVGHGLVVDEHLIYAAALLVLAGLRAGRYYGLEEKVASWPLFAKYPQWRSLID